MFSDISRRAFLKASAVAGASLVLPFRLPGKARAPDSPLSSFSPNAWLEISSDGAVKIWCGKSEVGQGVRTSLPMIVAEELSCDWKMVQVSEADLDPKYGEQLTGGSLSVRTSYDNLRKAGAAAREMLIAAAAAEWKVPRSECRAENSFIMHSPTGRKAAFEKLLAAASALQPPANPPLKRPSEFTLIGMPTRRTDTKLKITGSAAAAPAGRDPVEFLLSVLGPARKIDLGGDRGVTDVARRRRVVERAAEQSGWGKPLPKGMGRGMAAYFGYGSYVAQVAEVSYDAPAGSIRFHRVVCAIDCGTAVNPLGVKAQMEGAINFGLAAALKSAITVDRGQLQQSNFHDYEVLRMSDAPAAIDVHIAPGTDPPGGCGEPGVPPIAAALGNAIFAAKGKRVRRLPIRAADLRLA